MSVKPINNNAISIKSNGEIVMRTIAKFQKRVTANNIIEEISKNRQVLSLEIL